MLILPRRPINADAISYPSAAVPLSEVAHELMAKAETRRPYSGGVVRHALPTPELRGLQELEGYDHFEAVATSSVIEPVNRAMHEFWENHPWSSIINLGNLAFNKLIDHSGIHPHVDQSIDKNSGIPENGLLVVLLAISGITQYGLKPSGENPFNAKDRADFLEAKRRPRPTGMDYVTLKPGDALLIPSLSPVIHLSKALSTKRLVAAYAAPFKLRGN
ncbi:MAG: hypothetical protein ABIQ89_03800 [Candidatus Saccharimonadales bacterium]